MLIIGELERFKYLRQELRYEYFTAKGIRIIALTWVWAGPWMGAVLADMGAEVIKIETMQKLDTQRFIKVTKDTVEDINIGQFNVPNAV